MIPHSFGSDFGDQINRDAVLVDKNHNEFDVNVERTNGNIYFTKGWGALRDFYDITFGAWITVVFLGLGRFEIKKIKCRVKRKINFPTFVPPPLDSTLIELWCLLLSMVCFLHLFMIWHFVLNPLCLQCHV